MSRISTSCRPQAAMPISSEQSPGNFPRRAFLRGIGVSMALPWMESLRVWGDEPKVARGSSEAPVRLAVVFSGNGFHSREWWARGSGRGMELGQVLEPLAAFRERMLFIRGLFNSEAQKGNIHSSQTGNLLSGAPLASGGEIRSGTSFDQLLDLLQLEGFSKQTLGTDLGLIHRRGGCCRRRCLRGSRDDITGTSLLYVLQDSFRAVIARRIEYDVHAFDRLSQELRPSRIA